MNNIKVMLLSILKRLSVDWFGSLDYSAPLQLPPKEPKLYPPLSIVPAKPNNPPSDPALQYLTPYLLSQWEAARRELGAIYAITSVPPEFLYAIWFRESLQFLSPGPGGPFQFDPPRPVSYVAAVLSHWQLHLAARSLEDCWFTSALVAADFLQQKANDRIGGYATSWEVLADAAWGYNGRAYEHWSRSPYVSNDPEKGVNLRIVGTVISASGANVPVDQVDTRPGVMPIYRELLIHTGKVIAANLSS